jgi:putative phosphoesterase
MRLLLLSDTHVPTRARDLPAAVWEAVDTADLVVHAGDWMASSLLDALLERSRHLLACWGNNDGDDVRSRLPEIARRTVEGIRIAVTHETGAKTGRERRMDAAFPDTDLLVFGHSHIPWNTLSDNGMRLLNPGSPTDRRRQPHCTYMTLTLADGVIGDVDLVRL